MSESMEPCMGLQASEHKPMTYELGVFQRAYVSGEGRLWWELRYFFTSILEGARLLRIVSVVCVHAALADASHGLPGHSARSSASGFCHGACVIRPSMLCLRPPAKQADRLQELTDAVPWFCVEMDEIEVHQCHALMPYHQYASSRTALRPSNMLCVVLCNPS